MLHKPTEVAFYTTKFGFLQRADAPREALGEQFIWLAKLTAKPGKRDDVLEAARVHTGNVERDEKETYSFVVLESQDNDVDVLLFERYSGETYFKEVHSTSESMQEYRAKVSWEEWNGVVVLRADGWTDGAVVGRERECGLYSRGRFYGQEGDAALILLRDLRGKAILSFFPVHRQYYVGRAVSAAKQMCSQRLVCVLSLSKDTAERCLLSITVPVRHALVSCTADVLSLRKDPYAPKTDYRKRSLQFGFQD